MNYNSTLCSKFINDYCCGFGLFESDPGCISMRDNGQLECVSRCLAINNIDQCNPELFGIYELFYSEQKRSEIPGPIPVISLTFFLIIILKQEREEQEREQRAEPEREESKANENENE